jgi:hypothetical protein
LMSHAGINGILLTRQATSKKLSTPKSSHDQSPYGRPSDLICSRTSLRYPGSALWLTYTCLTTMPARGPRSGPPVRPASKRAARGREGGALCTSSRALEAHQEGSGTPAGVAPRALPGATSAAQAAQKATRARSYGRRHDAMLAS